MLLAHPIMKQIGYIEEIKTLTAFIDKHLAIELNQTQTLKLLYLRSEWHLAELNIDLLP